MLEDGFVVEFWKCEEGLGKDATQNRVWYFYWISRLIKVAGVAERRTPEKGPGRPVNGLDLDPEVAQVVFFFSISRDNPSTKISLRINTATSCNNTTDFTIITDPRNYSLSTNSKHGWRKRQSSPILIQ
jgi:hypothetical protein